jgi:hypothetical protein
MASTQSALSMGSYFAELQLRWCPDITVLFGTAPGCVPIVGDWNGDGVDTIGVFVPANFFGVPTFAMNNVNANLTGSVDLQFAFAADGDLPIAGDWDGKPANTPPDSGINNPAEGFSRAEQTQVFTTTCSDPDGWHDLSSIDFKIATSRKAGRDDDDREDRGKSKDQWRDEEDRKDKHDDDGLPLVLWVRFDENRDLVRFYDPDHGRISARTDDRIAANVMVILAVNPLFRSDIGRCENRLKRSA